MNFCDLGDLENRQSIVRGSAPHSAQFTMADTKQSQLLDDLASFYTSFSNMDYKSSPVKVTPPTSDSEGDPPLFKVDPVILQELKMLFLNETTTSTPVRRTKPPPRNKSSNLAMMIGGQAGDRRKQPGVPSSSRSVMTSMPSSKYKEDHSDSRSVAASVAKSLYEGGSGTTRDRLSRRSRSSSVQGYLEASTGRSKLETLLAQVAPRSQSQVSLHEFDQSQGSFSYDNRRRRRQRGSGDSKLESGENAPFQIRPERKWATPSRTQSDMSATGSLRNHGWDARRKRLVAADEQSLAGKADTKLEDAFEFKTTFEPLKGEDDNVTSDMRSGYTTTGRRRTPSRTRSDDLNELSTSQRGNDRGVGRGGSRRLAVNNVVEATAKSALPEVQVAEKGSGRDLFDGGFFDTRSKG